MKTARMPTDHMLWVERTMTQEEKEKFLDRFFKANTRWRGAHVADVLDALVSHDAHLDIIDPIYDEHRHKFPKEKSASPVILALYYAYGHVDWHMMKDFFERMDKNDVGP